MTVNVLEPFTAAPSQLLAVDQLLLAEFGIPPVQVYVAARLDEGRRERRTNKPGSHWVCVFTLAFCFAASDTQAEIYSAGIGA